MSEMNEECKAIFKSIDKKLGEIATKQDVTLQDVASIRQEITMIREDIDKIAKKLLAPIEQKELHSGRRSGRQVPLG